MNPLSRGMEQKVLELFAHFPVVAVLGARQVGKTTLVEKLGIPGLKTFTLDSTIDLGGARSDPDFFLQQQPRPLFLDEVQYAPELLGSLKREVDRRQTPGQFLLSGSQNLAVLRSVSESLAGRVAIVELWPLSLAELGGDPARTGWLERAVRDEAFPEQQAVAVGPPALFPLLWRGGLPGLLTLPDHLCPTYFSSYRQTYIERDVRTAAGVSSLQHFGRFIGLLAALTASEVNHNELGRELGVDRKTALAWTGVAAATYQWHEVPAYSRNAIKRLAGKPKGFFSDTGLACHFQGLTTAEQLLHHPGAGRLFETWVFGEVKKRAATWNAGPNIFHYRTLAGAEVDLLLEMDGVLHPIEVKMTANPSGRDLRGIDSFRDTFPKARLGTGLLVCAIPAATRLRPDVWAVPWWEL